MREPAILRPADLKANDRGGGARTIDAEHGHAPK